jgi:hypothetical protein
MMRRVRLPLAVATLAVLVSCQSDSLTRSIDGPMFAVSDGAHHGNPDFFFLPPLFNNPSKNPNFEPAAFNGTLRPAVEICELGAPAPDGSRECIAGPLVKRFAPGTVNVSLTDQQYQVNWTTNESALNVNKFYRISVAVGPTQLGFADVDPVSSASQLKNVQTGEYIALVDGRTLPIKFRIENGALCGTDGTACAAETVNLAQGGGVELTVPGEDFHFDVPAGTQAMAGGQIVTEVTFNLETCDGIDVDLPKFGQCLRVTALYDAPGAVLTLTQPVLISMCSFVPVSEGQQELITLHQQDGDLIRALPHAHPNCDVIGAREAAPAGLAARSWHWMRDVAATLLTPRTLYAETRTSVLHLGGGGESTRLGADCTAPSSIAIGMALTTCAPSVAAVTPFPMFGRTISDFQFALPAKMDYVDPDDASRSAPAGTALPTAVKVTDWNNDAVQGATVTFTRVAIEGPGTVIGTAISNSDGIAQVSWTIDAGPNGLVASGRGIAAQNNYPGGTVKPFMPDIFSGAPQTPVVVGIGEIPFLATGVTSIPRLDQQNLLDGSLGGQGIGRFNDSDGSPDPNGTLFDFQDAQTFTVGTSGRLTAIKVPIINGSGAAAGVTMQIVAVVDGVPDEGNSLGEVTIPATAISTNFDDMTNPAAWASFDLTSLEITVVQGQELAFIVRSFSVSAFLFDPEFSSGYANGSGYRRNRALSASWSNSEADFGFQTFVIPN